jgi:hypothetical protein
MSWGIFGNMIGTPWEHDGNKKETPPPHCKRKKKPSILIVCLKLLFPKWVVTIFGMGYRQGHKL